MAPADGEVQLVIALGRQVVLDVHRPSLGVGYGLGDGLLRVEVPELIKHAEGVHQILAAEEHTRLGVELAAHDVLVDDVITTDLHLVDGGLRSLGDADVERYGVALDVGLDGIYACEDVAIIIVEVAHSVLIGGEAALQALLVVDVAWADAEDLLQHLAGVLSVPDEAYILDVVLLPFVQTQVDVHLALAWDGDDAIGEELGVAVAVGLVLLDEVLQVLLVVGVDELLLAEDLQEGGQCAPSA